MKKRSARFEEKSLFKFKIGDWAHSPQVYYVARAPGFFLRSPPHATAESHGHMLHVCPPPHPSFILPNTSAVTWTHFFPAAPPPSLDSAPANARDPSRDRAKRTAARFRGIDGLKALPLQAVPLQLARRARA